MNGPIYNFVAFILQASRAHNIKIGGGRKYNVPSEEITVDKLAFGPSQPGLKSYVQEAVFGADDFKDVNTTVKEVFDIVVNTTREFAPTCELSFSLISVRFSYLARIESDRSGVLGECEGEHYLRIY